MTVNARIPFEDPPHLLDTAYPTQVPPGALTDAHPAAFYLSLCCPCPYKTLGFTPEDNSTGLQAWGQGIDGSTFGLTTIDGITNLAAESPLWDILPMASIGSRSRASTRL